jgi:hypothetical protein
MVFLFLTHNSHFRIFNKVITAQRQRKQAFLRERGICSFYYLSHAPLVLMAATEERKRFEKAE